MMSEFQLSLLTIGFIVVAGVYFYGCWQQWRFRRSQGYLFNRDDGEISNRTESNSMQLHDGQNNDTSNSPTVIESESVFNFGDETCGLLNDATDYVATFVLKTPHTSDALEVFWRRRFDFGKNVNIFGLSTSNGMWERIIPESVLTYRAFRLGLQLVDRTGSVSELRVEGFRNLLGEMAAKLKIEVSLPSIDGAMQRAQELDRFCAEVDQMIVINLLTSDDRKLFGTEVSTAAERQGMVLQTDGSFHLMDEKGVSLFNLSASDGTTFQHHTLNKSRVDSLTLLLDIPRVDDPVRRFDEMVTLANELAKTLLATLTDDQRVALSSGAIDQIRAKVSVTETLMLNGNITPGSTQARRLFS